MLDIASGQERCEINWPEASDISGPSYAFAPIFSADGSRVLNVEGTLARICDPTTGERVAILKGHQGCINWVFISSDGTRAFTSSVSNPPHPSLTGDDTLRIWDIEQGTCLAVLALDGAWSKAVSPRGDMLAITKPSDSPDGPPDGGTVVYRRHFPEYWWGHFTRLEVWFALVLGAAWLWAVATWVRRNINITRGAKA